MTKEDVLKLFPDATPEQITNLLNINDTDVSKAGAGAAELKEKAKKYDALEAEKLSLEQKAQKALEEAEKAKSDNLKALNRTKAIAELTKAGLTEEEFSDILDGFVTDDEEATITRAKSFASLISKKKADYEAEHKHNDMKNMDKPNGGKPENKAMSEGEQMALNVAKAQAESLKAAADSRKYYVGGM